MAVPYHVHDFEIPTATKYDVIEGTAEDKAVVPASLGTAAASNAEDFADAAQGALADTALQPSDVSAVATTGDYEDLENKPTLGSAAAADTTDFATAAEGVLAGTAMQPDTYDPDGIGADAFAFGNMTG